jgi:hypothetical protein
MMVHPEVVIHPCIGLVDWSPSRVSQLDSGYARTSLAGFGQEPYLSFWTSHPHSECLGSRFSGGKVGEKMYLSFKPQFLTSMNGAGFLEVI